MLRTLLTLSCIAVLYCSVESCAYAQIKAATADSVVRYGDTQITRYRVGASINAKRGAVRDVLAIVAVPLSCPEQEVELIEEDISDYVRTHDYRLLPGGGARQMLIRVPQLPNKAKAHAILTFEVRTRVILPPAETSELVIPKKTAPRTETLFGQKPIH